MKNKKAIILILAMVIFSTLVYADTVQTQDSMMAALTIDEGTYDLNAIAGMITPESPVYPIKRWWSEFIIPFNSDTDAARMRVSIERIAEAMKAPTMVQRKELLSDSDRLKNEVIVDSRVSELTVQRIYIRTLVLQRVIAQHLNDSTTANDALHGLVIALNNSQIQEIKRITSVFRNGSVIQNICELERGGQWKQFENGCADDCVSLKYNDSDRICTLLMKTSCDCGNTKCWNGRECLLNVNYANESQSDYNESQLHNMTVRLPSNWLKDVSTSDLACPFGNTYNAATKGCNTNA